MGLVDKFQAVIVKQNSHMYNQYTLNIDDNQVILEKSVKALGINIDNDGTRFLAM